MRTVPVVLDIAGRVAERAAPDAWIVDFTNPVGIVTRALLDAGHRAVGLCNVAIGLQRHFARLLGVDPAQVVVDQVGLNHLTWVRAVRIDGEDELPALLAEHGDELAERGRAPALAARRAGRDPLLLPALLLRARHRARRAAQRRGAARGRRSRRSSASCCACTATRRSPRSRRCSSGAAARSTARRPSGSCASLETGDGDVHVVDMRNGGTLAGLADDDVVEVPARVGRDGPEPLPQAPLAPELLGLVQHVAAYERLTAEAAVTRDRGHGAQGVARPPADRPVSRRATAAERPAGRVEAVR